jgi:uncharacterized protein (TIGR00369 family)
MAEEAQTVDERSRTFEWVDPRAAAQVAREVGGLEYNRMAMRGDIPLPPICELIGFRFVLVDPGETGMEFDPAEYHYNAIGTVHGGIVCTLLDSVMSISVSTAIPADYGFATLQVNVNFVRPVVIGNGLMRCDGKVVHRGTRTATAEGRLVDAKGKLYAHGTATCMTFPLGAA